MSRGCELKWPLAPSTLTAQKIANLAAKVNMGTCLPPDSQDVTLTLESEQLQGMCNKIARRAARKGAEARLLQRE